VGGYKGAGAGVRWDRGRFGVALGAGWQPLVLETSIFPVLPFYTSVGSRGDTDLIPAWQAHADVRWVSGYLTSYSVEGFSAGYRYSTLLGHGASLAVEIELGRGHRWSFSFSCGLTFFPHGKRRVIDRAEYPEDTELVPDLLAGISLGVSLFP
jgi:hypothetical protein